MRNNRVAAVVAAVLGTISLGAQADTLKDIFTQGHVDGELRAYNFDRVYGTNTVPDAHTLAGALLLNVGSGTFGDGFSLSASLATANAFGTQSKTISKVDTTLMGPSDSVTALSQAYAQYQNKWVLVRGGYQYLNTPWMGGSDSRVIPASYNALMADFTPSKGWDIIGLRSFGWKSRTSSGYTEDNLYYPPTYAGDSMYGGSGGLPATTTAANGTWALGSTYAAGNLKAQGWYYNFLNFSSLGYVDGSYTFKTGTGVDPFVGAQYVTETGSSNNFLVTTGTKIDGIAGNEVKSNTWGADVGIAIRNGRFDVAYNKISQKAGAVGAGAIISPYTASYATDPLYTTSMIRGLVEQGPGHAWKVKAAYNFFSNKLQLLAAYARYTTDLRGNSNNVYFDVIYNLDGYLKGLSLRNRWERSTGGTGLNPGNQPFTYNRVMISYKF